jgi:hypothetical protein
MNNPFRKSFNLIINYFKNYPLKTRKIHDFQSLCKIPDVIINRKHKTVEGFDMIVKLKN